MGLTEVISNGMIVSYKWLQFYFKDPLPEPEDLVNVMVPHSFELDELKQVGNDWAMDFDVLSNRGHDALSHFGMARELAVIFDREMVVPDSSYETSDEVKTGELLDIKVADSKLVRRVMKRMVVNVKVGPSPDWLVEHLATIGQKSINNVVDITNFVMFETGHPLHAFDYDKLAPTDSSGLAGSEKKLMEVRMSRPGEPLRTLDGKDLEMGDNSLVWADSEKALDLAGVKGGDVSGVDEGTTRIVLSCCNFEPINVRKTRKRHKIITDASRRYEADLSPELAALTVERASHLFSEYAGATIASDIIDIYPEPQQPAEARFKLSQFNSLIGVELSESDVESILDRMGKANYSWQKDGEEYVVAVPMERLDVRELHEVIEEVARFYGYDKVTSRLAPKEDFTPKVHKGFYYNSLLKKTLVEELGYSELYNYVMRDRGVVELQNSMVEGMSFLRDNMLDTLERNLHDNNKNLDVLGLDQIRVFELNKVFSMEEEHWALGLGVSSTKAWKGESNKETIEATIAALEEKLGVKGEWKIEDRDSGVVAEVNVEKLIESLETPESYGGVLSAGNSQVKFRAFSQYPAVLRDIAVWTPEGTTAEDLLALIKEQSGDLLVQSRLFDEFSKDGRTSYAYKLAFQSMEKTLTDQEVGEIMDLVTETLNDKEGFEVR